MKPAAAFVALFACLAFVKVAPESNIQGPQRSEPAPAESQKILRSEGQPVETPLVEKLLRSPAKNPEKPIETTKRLDSVTTPADGQLSPRGQWRWSQAQWAWVPVKQAGPDWVQVGHHAATVDHLVNAHGFDRATAERLTPAQRDVAHSNAHNAESRRVVPVRSSGQGCPGGVCPSPSRSRGLFRWR